MGIRDLPMAARIMHRPNPLSPHLMNSQERIEEVCKILARGLVRLKARKSRQLSANQGDSCLDFPPPEGGHEPVETKAESKS